MNREIKYLFVFLKPYLKYEFLLLLLIMAATITGMASPYFLKIILDEIIPGKNFSLLVNVLLILTGIYFVRLLIGIVSDYLKTWLENKIMNSIKTRLFTNLLDMPFSYFETNKPGDIIQKISHEADKIQYFLSTSIIRFLNSSLTVIFLVCILCWLDFKMFLLTVCVIPFSIIINNRVAKKIRGLVQDTSKQEGDIFNFYFDRVRNIKLIKTFNAQDREISDLGDRMKKLFGLYQKTSFISSMARNFIILFVSFGPLIVFAYGGYQVMHGMLSVGALVAYIQYMNRIYAPSNDLSGLYVDFVRASESAKRIYPILSRTPDAQLFSSPAPEQVNSIGVNNLSFSYDNVTPVLNNISIDFQKGKKYVITGVNGCGKSTLIKFLCKLYMSPGGTIIVNKEIDLNSIAQADWTDKITVVSQESSVLYDSLRNNLRYGDPHASDARLKESLAIVSLSDFINGLPKGLETQIGDGEGSVIPSGGQAQLIALARMFLKSKDLIILDEVTSSVDAEKEPALIREIFSHGQDAIIIAISHKLSSIMEFDEVIHMTNGKITETGHPAELLARQKGFYELFKSQSQPTSFCITEN